MLLESGNQEKGSPMRKDGLETLPTSFRYVAALVSAMLVSSLPFPVLSQSVELMVVDVHSVAEGYRASKLIGSSGVNDQSQKVGTVEHIIIGQGKVPVAVLEVVGCL